MSVTTTFLGAHALPPEFAGRADDYITEVCGVMLPALVREGLVDAVDAFCENIGFSREQTQRVFDAATAQGIRVKLHAEQLSDMRGASLAAAFRALSADHLEFAEEDGIAAMAKAGTAAVLLPGAFYFLRETRVPPVDAAAPARRADRARHRLQSRHLADDVDPARHEHGGDAVSHDGGRMPHRRDSRGRAGVGARADSVGTLEAGKQCDLAIWDVDAPAELVYAIGRNPLHARIWKGQ